MIIKTKSEIKILKKSAQIADSCIPLIEKSLKEKITEKELKRRIGRKIRSQGASLAFQTLVACSKRSAMIHPKPHAINKIIRGIGYVDFGPSYKGYKSDVTVPFIKGEISKKERKIVETVLQAYKLAISSIRLRMLCWKLYEKVDRFLRKKRFKMVHALGHGLGKKVHELPMIGKPRKKVDLSKRQYEKLRKKWEKIKKIKFQENMVFTIEPAIYVKGLGGCRIENDVLMTRKGPKILTHSKLIEV